MMQQLLTSPTGIRCVRLSELHPQEKHAMALHLLGGEKNYENKNDGEHSALLETRYQHIEVCQLNRALAMKHERNRKDSEMIKAHKALTQHFKYERSFLAHLQDLLMISSHLIITRHRSRWKRIASSILVVLSTVDPNTMKQNRTT